MHKEKTFETRIVVNLPLECTMLDVVAIVCQQVGRAHLNNERGYHANRGKILELQSINARRRCHAMVRVHLTASAAIFLS